MNDEELKKLVSEYVLTNSLFYKYSTKAENGMDMMKFDIIKVGELIDSIITTNNRNSSTNKEIKRYTYRLSKLRERLKDTVFDSEFQISTFMHTILECENNILIQEALEKYR